MHSIAETLTAEFGKLNARFRTVSITHMDELKEEIQRWRQEGIIGKKFYSQNYDFFRFEKPEMPWEAQSIIIVANPQGIIPLAWRFHGTAHQVIIPPTYRYTGVRALCTEILTKVFQREGLHVTRAILPFKLLAARSGLGMYGRNNLCYVQGIGSFVRLEAFYTDYAFPTDDWQEKKQLARCEQCALCRNACPTHCIPSERFLIHADHCLTYFNEFEEPFPEWVEPRWHNALVGCMRCQQVCPENRDVIHRKEEEVRFSEAETMLVLEGTPKEELPPGLTSKLKDLNINEYYPMLSRNLSVLIKKS
jgi:epoxyqueuosine reductase